MRIFLPCCVLAMGKLMVVSWEPTMPTKVSPCSCNRGELEMGGKLSKKLMQIFAFQALFQVLGNADKAATWAMQARQEGPLGFFFFNRI